MKILVLTFKAGIPLIELLCSNYNNSRHENHIEIARKYWLVEPEKRQTIILLWGEGEYHHSVYTANDFQRTYQNPLTPPTFPIQ